MDFVRFPRTPHLAWLGAGLPRDDKVLTKAEITELLHAEVTVEEKVDGANIGISTDENGELCVQNRGAYVRQGHCHEQFATLFQWLDARRTRLADALFPDLILFGEWCRAVHGIHYTRLPDWYLAFDVFDRSHGEFWSVARRDALVRTLDLALVPRIAVGRFDVAGLTSLLGPSQLTDGPAEGLYVRRDESGHLVARAKLVRREFVQTIDEHWSRRRLRFNALARDGRRSQERRPGREET